MSEKKKSPKKSLEYARPEPGTFELRAFPGVVFRFRKITIDDEAWCIDTLGGAIGDIIRREKERAGVLCRLYFHCLTDEGKRHFLPEKRVEVDYENGGEKEVVVSGPRLFMQAIDGGSVTEIIMIARAFLKTIAASRPIDDLPEDLKKSVMKWLAEDKKPKPEPGPMGSEVVDLRKGP